MTTLKVQDLLEAGAHFGHQTRKWNPKMKPYVYGQKNGIYIIDLTKTMKQIYDACNFLQSIVSEGGKILFVGTKRQAQGIIKEAAEKTDMYYVTERWLGGTLTNNRTIQKSVAKMKEIDEIIASPERSASLKKKEIVNLTRTVQKMHKNLDGIAKMNKLPAALFVVDVCTEEIAVKEAAKLKIPVVAIVDTNGSTDNIAYPIVANDDAVKSIKLITDVIAEAVKDAAELYKRRVEENKIETDGKSKQTDDKELSEQDTAREKSTQRRRKAPSSNRSERGTTSARPRPPQRRKPKSDDGKQAPNHKKDGQSEKNSSQTDNKSQNNPDKKGE